MHLKMQPTLRLPLNNSQNVYQLKLKQKKSRVRMKSKRYVEDLASEKVND